MSLFDRKMNAEPQQPPCHLPADAFFATSKRVLSQYDGHGLRLLAGTDKDEGGMHEVGMGVLEGELLNGVDSLNTRAKVLLAYGRVLLHEPALCPAITKAHAL